MSPPILSPPALHFVVVDFTITCGTMELTFWCQTDVACHLTLHMADIDPIIRNIPYQKRGANFNLSSVTCFVEIKTIDQDEAGDTTTHTFTVPLTSYDLTHYWYLTGTQGGIPMKSMSQIFKASCSKPVEVITCKCTPVISDTYSQCCSTEWHYFIRPLVSQTLIKGHFILGRRGSYPQCNIHRFAVWHCNSSKIPDYIIASSIIYLPLDLPPGGFIDCYFPFSGGHLDAGELYTIAHKQWEDQPLRCSQYWATWKQGQTDPCISLGYSNWYQMYYSGGWKSFSGARIFYELTATED